MASAAAIHHLPAALVPAIRPDVGAALRVAHTANAGPYAQTIVTIARQSFVTAFHLASLIGASILILAAAAVMKWLPARPRDDASLPAAATDAVHGSAPTLPDELTAPLDA